jgi:hypothetical protein
MLNSVMNRTAMMLIGVPILPRVKGPGGKNLRPVRTLAKKGMAYEVVLRMMNDPVRSRKAAEEPRGMAPRPVAITAAES